MNCKQPLVSGHSLPQISQPTNGTGSFTSFNEATAELSELITRLTNSPPPFSADRQWMTEQYWKMLADELANVSSNLGSPEK